MEDVTKFLKTGLVSPEFVWRIVVVAIGLTTVWLALNHKVASVVADNEAIKVSMTNIVSKVDAMHDDALLTGQVVRDMDARTKRIEAFLDSQNVRQRQALAAQP